MRDQVAWHAWVLIVIFVAAAGRVARRDCVLHHLAGQLARAAGRVDRAKVLG